MIENVKMVLRTQHNKTFYTLDGELNKPGVRLYKIYVNGEEMDRAMFNIMLDPRTIIFTRPMRDDITVTATVVDLNTEMVE